MIRSLLFMPLYTKFIMTMHRPDVRCEGLGWGPWVAEMLWAANIAILRRDCVSGQPHALTRFFGSRPVRHVCGVLFKSRGMSNSAARIQDLKPNSTPRKPDRAKNRHPSPETSRPETLNPTFKTLTTLL